MLPHNSLPQVQAGTRASAAVGQAIVDRDLRFVEVNDALAALHGVPVAAHLGRTVSEALPLLGPALEPLLRQVLATGTPIEQVELAGVIAGPAASRRRLLASFYPVRARSGFVLGVEAVVHELPQERTLP